MPSWEAANIHELRTTAPLNERGRALASLDGMPLLVSRFDAHPKWEIHPQGDELLQVIEGELEVTLLTDDRPTLVLAVGDVFVVPRDTWHSPVPRGTVTLLSTARYDGTRVSDLDDPRS